MQSSLDHINRIYDKLLKVEEKMTSLEKDNSNLKQINKKLREDLDRLSTENIEMKAAMTNVEQSSAKSSSELTAYKMNVQKEIDFYLKKVDKCISLVSQS